MRAVYKQPGKPAEVIEVENTLEALQKKVGGYIETVTFTTDTCVICNDGRPQAGVRERNRAKGEALGAEKEGRLMGLPYNLNFLGLDLVGPVLWVGVKGEEFTDLNKRCVNFLMERWGK